MTWVFEIVEPEDEAFPRDTISFLEQLYRGGKTLQQLGDLVGVSRERIRQLINTSVGGASVRRQNWREEKAAAKRAKRAKKDERIASFFGCSYDDLVKINGPWNWTLAGGKVKEFKANAYINQRRAAKFRGIEWKLTFPQWWKIWEESGKYDQRGRGKGKYCMSRPTDTGPYEEGNVAIILSTFNSSQARLFEKQQDELGLIKSQRRVYDAIQSGVTGTSDLAKLLGMSGPVVRQYKISLRARGLLK